MRKVKVTSRCKVVDDGAPRSPVSCRNIASGVWLVVTTPAVRWHCVAADDRVSAGVFAEHALTLTTGLIIRDDFLSTRVKLGPYTDLDFPHREMNGLVNFDVFVPPTPPGVRPHDRYY